MKGDERMTDRELERLYKDSPELQPPSELKEKILLRMSEETERKKEKNDVFSFGILTKKFMPIAVCFMLVLVAIGGMLGFSNENYQTVYIDVNPSAALHVNRFGKISGVDYLNKDAENVLDGIKLKGLSAENALEKMLNAYADSGYFDTDAEIYISAVSDKNKNADRILEKLLMRAEKIKGDRGYSVNVKKLTAEDRAEADEYGISPGKYRVISEVIEKNPNYTVEDLKDKSMAELKELLKNGKENVKERESFTKD